MLREEIKKSTEKAIKKLQEKTFFPNFRMPEVVIDHPENEDYGDYSANVALVISRIIAKSIDSHVGDVVWMTKENIYRKPKEVGEEIKKEIESEKNLIIGKIEIAESGFINFFISKEYLQKQVSEILKQKEKFGNLKIGKERKINVEFISANPTGPLTLGNGRGGFCGDVLSNVLETAGHKVCREYYINDRGEQVVKLGHSIIGDSEAVYKGPYIEELRKKIKDVDPAAAGDEGAKKILEKMIKPAVKKMGIKFDVWFSEKSLYQKSKIKKALDFLGKKELVYEKDGALWFKSTQFGDDKDRVLIKANGEETYFLSDIAYLNDKFKRGFEKLIFFWGADHYGYIERLKAAAQALGYKREQADIAIMQLVQLFQQGKEVRMSKRTGIYVTIDELIDEVGLDVARFFFLTRSPGSHLNFDLDLAKEQSGKNPVYYVQYAHARICSILKKAPKYKNGKTKFELLSHPSELKLIKQLIRLSEVIEDTAKDYQVQRLPQYAQDLAAVFHAFYRDCRVISEDQDLTRSRLSLALATKIVLKNTLDLMGIKSPEKM